MDRSTQQFWEAAIFIIPGLQMRNCGSESGRELLPELGRGGAGTVMHTALILAFLQPAVIRPSTKLLIVLAHVLGQAHSHGTAQTWKVCGMQIGPWTLQSVRHGF